MVASGLIYINGGLLQDDHGLPEDYNTLHLYEGSTLPSLGYVLQGNIRVAESTHNFYGTMVNTRNDEVVFVNRELYFDTRRGLNVAYENDDPVLILVWNESDLVPGSYKMQPCAVNKTAVSAIEYFTPIIIEVLGRVE